MRRTIALLVTAVATVVAPLAVAAPASAHAEYDWVIGVSAYDVSGPGCGAQAKGHVVTVHNGGAKPCIAARKIKQMAAGDVVHTHSKMSYFKTAYWRVASKHAGRGSYACATDATFVTKIKGTSYTACVNRMS
jgi:hypothetical protein